MARGNDADAAARELQARQGVAGNAEELIQLVQGTYDRDLRAANAKKVDAAATDALDAAAIEKHVDGEVASFAVRGDTVVAVVIGDDLRSQKVAIPLDDVLTRAQARRVERAREEAQQEADLRAKSPEGDEPAQTPARGRGGRS